jgi:hypothetical protein
MASSSRNVPSASDVALRREVVDFGRLDLAEQPQKVRRIGHVAVVQEKPDTGVVAVAVEVVDALGVQQRRTALDTVHDVALRQQEIGEIGAVLPGDPGDERYFPGHAADLSIYATLRE